MKSKIKILTVVNSLNMGGIEKTLLSYIKFMNHDDIEMVLCCFKKGGVLENEFRHEKIKIIYIKKTGLIFCDFIQMFFILLFGKYNIVHSRFGFTSGGFVLAGKILKIPIIVSVHSSQPSALEMFRRKRIIYKLLQVQLQFHKLITLRYAEKIIGHSKANLNYNFVKWEKNKLFKIIHNGIDFSKLDEEIHQASPLKNFIKKDDFVILHIGSFRKEKNHEFLLNGFKLLLKKSDKYKLILVGNGSLEEEMKALAIDLNIEKNVYFVGFDKSINKYFDVADLFLMPSLIEGFGNVIIEAQYCSVPICCSKIPALQESGYLDYHQYYFEPNNIDDFEKNVFAIIKNIEDNQLGETITKAKIFAENFSIQKMAVQLEELYKFKSSHNTVA